jgi:NADH:ubiquinone oxidoreductase subunit 5 (subunit L)/multisubunit Na+/H+ antiporter MnhA subunit
VQAIRQQAFSFMYLNILFLPFLSFIVSSCFGRFIGREGSMIISTGCIILTAVLSTITFYEVAIASSNCYLQVTT